MTEKYVPWVPFQSRPLMLEQPEYEKYVPYVEPEESIQEKMPLVQFVSKVRVSRNVSTDRKDLYREHNQVRRCPYCHSLVAVTSFSDHLPCSG